MGCNANRLSDMQMPALVDPNPHNHHRGHGGRRSGPNPPEQAAVPQNARPPSRARQVGAGGVQDRRIDSRGDVRGGEE